MEGSPIVVRSTQEFGSNVTRHFSFTDGRSEVAGMTSRFPGISRRSAPYRVRSLEKRRELQIAVAMRTRQRRPARCVLLNEIRDDGVPELALEIDDVVRKADDGGDAARVVEIVERAATAPRLLAAALIVELHRQTDNVMTLLREQGRGD
jgi:hypothetical protein